MAQEDSTALLRQAVEKDVEARWHNRQRDVHRQAATKARREYDEIIKKCRALGIDAEILNPKDAEGTHGQRTEAPTDSRT